MGGEQYPVYVVPFGWLELPPDNNAELSNDEPVIFVQTKKSRHINTKMSRLTHNKLSGLTHTKISGFVHYFDRSATGIQHKKCDVKYPGKLPSSPNGQICTSLYPDEICGIKNPDSICFVLSKMDISRYTDEHWMKDGLYLLSKSDVI